MKDKKLPLVLAAVDLCIFKIVDGVLCVYLVKNNNELYKNLLCIPGSLIGLNESTEDALARIAKEKTSLNIKSIYKEQLYSFSGINRDKRSRAISVAYLCLYSGNEVEGFVDISKIKKLAYDHSQILKFALERLKSKLEYTTIVQKLIKNSFTFSELQKTYEVIFGREIDKRNFRKKIDSLNILQETGNKIQSGKMRPAKEYAFVSDEVNSFKLFGEM